MITNGEKYACESCIRGHRVAQCQHTDRPLQRVGKKGRPVSQCNHCRSLRTSRSVHTRCKCGSVSRQATLRLFGEERCLCCEGGDCTCAYKTGQTSTSSPSATSDQSTPELDALRSIELRRLGIGPRLPHATLHQSTHRVDALRAMDLSRTDVAITHRMQEAAMQRITGGSGTCCAQTDVGLNNEYSEDVNDTWIPVNGPPLETPQSPDWSGLWEPDLQPISDEQDQFNMEFFDPSLTSDPNVDPWFDYLDHLPEQSYTDPIFDPALLDLTPLTFDGRENHQGTF
ncbi:hypothetical protein CEP53_009392 [Fusarium sp. AF-6]|nr:hypothetical protein CEP53_009392 [Fusarium sp. AF-6]